MKQLRSKTQIKRFLEAAEMREMDVAFLLQDWADGYNVGGMFRVADACGAVEIFASGKTPTLENPMVGVTSMGAHRRMPFHHFARHDEAVAAAKAVGYTLVAVEVADSAVSYTEFEYPDKLCLVLGSEGGGIYGNVLKQCDAAVFIPMAGKGRSINVHVAAAVVAFHARCATMVSSSEPDC